MMISCGVRTNCLTVRLATSPAVANGLAVRPLGTMVGAVVSTTVGELRVTVIGRSSRQGVSGGLDGALGVVVGLRAGGLALGLAARPVVVVAIGLGLDVLT